MPVVFVLQYLYLFLGCHFRLPCYLLFSSLTVSISWFVIFIVSIKVTRSQASPGDDIYQSVMFQFEVCIFFYIFQLLNRFYRAHVHPECISVVTTINCSLILWLIFSYKFKIELVYHCLTFLFNFFLLSFFFQGMICIVYHFVQGSEIL